MKKIKIKTLNEEVIYDKLDNGLEVYLVNKPSFTSSYVTFTTKYGSIYNEFVPLGETKMKKFPKGIAHFLEHKVFAVKDGPDPMEFFAKSGSICNAYTTFNNTTYLFYATDELEDNISYLLDFVQDLYLTPESVENEKKIISEEIHMYDDKPGEILSEKIRYNALHSNPYRDSIIGTVKDISKITKEDLETCYQTFYHPSNMFLIVVGSFDPDKVLNVIRNNQSKKKFKSLDKIKIKEIKEEDDIFKKSEVVHIPTSIPKASVTLKINTKKNNISRRKLSLYLYILFSSMFDETSSFDEKLKKDKIITNTTYISTLNTNTHILVSITNETDKYEEFIEYVIDKIKNISITKDNFARKKKVLISNEIFAYEYAEQINDILLDDLIFDDKIESDPIGVINSLNMDELDNIISMIDTDNISKVIIKNN